MNSVFFNCLNIITFFDLQNNFSTYLKKESYRKLEQLRHVLQGSSVTYS